MFFFILGCFVFLFLISQMSNRSKSNVQELIFFFVSTVPQFQANTKNQLFQKPETCFH